MNTSKGKISAQRLGLYRKIEFGLKQLPHMDEAAYREMLKNNFQDKNGNPVSSKSGLSDGQLSRLVGMLAQMGAVFTSSGSNKKIRPHARPDWIEIPDGSPYCEERRQICAIWKKLGYSMSSLETRVERQFGVKTILWLHNGDHVSALLTDMQKRERAFDKKQKIAGGLV